MITESIIKSAQTGNSDAFAIIYNETIKTAYYVAKRILIDEDATEDVLQEAYISVFKHLSEYKTGNLQGWIDTIVANRAKNYLRTKNPILFSEMETEENPVVDFEEEKIEFRPDEKIDYDETQRLILEIVDNLSPEQRLSIMLFYFENKGVKEIAQICECSENTVKSRLNYARKKIKEDVLELEKKGTKLYSVSVIPFIIWMLSEKAKAATIPESVSANILSNITTNAVANTVASSVANSATSSATNIATNAATNTVANTIPAAVAKAGISLGAKIGISIATLAVVAGGIIGAITLTNNNDTNSVPTEPTSIQSSVNNTDKTETPTEPTDISKLTAKEVMVNIYGVDVPLIITKNELIALAKSSNWAFVVGEKTLRVTLNTDLKYLAVVQFNFRDGATADAPKETYEIEFNENIDWNQIKVYGIDADKYIAMHKENPYFYDDINNDIRIDVHYTNFSISASGNTTFTSNPDIDNRDRAYGFESLDFTKYGSDEYVNTIINNIYGCEELMNLEYFYRTEVVSQVLHTLKIFDFGEQVAHNHFVDGSTILSLVSGEDYKYCIDLKHNFTGETYYITDEYEVMSDIANAEFRAYYRDYLDPVEDYYELLNTMENACAKLQYKGKLAEFTINGYNIDLVTTNGVKYTYVFNNTPFYDLVDEIYKGVNDPQTEYNSRK